MGLVDDFVGSLYEREASKIKIADAVSRLLEQEPFDQIRVQQICSEAGVSRNTFYRHFSSKYDVVQWYWLRMAERYLFRVGRDLTWRESFRLNFEFAAPQVDFYSVVSKEKGYESVGDFGCRARIESLEATIANEVGAPLDDDLRFQVRFFAVAESRLAGEAVQQSQAFDAETIAERLESCVPSRLRDLLDGHVLEKRRAAGAGSPIQS